MANPIPCDNAEKHDDPNAPVLAVVLLHQIDTGEVTSFCGECFLEMCIATAKAVEDVPKLPAEAPKTAATGDDDEDDDEDAVARLKTVRRGTSASRKQFEARKRDRIKITATSTPGNLHDTVTIEPVDDDDEAPEAPTE